MFKLKGGNIFVWIILGLLIVGLMGFSSGGFGNNIRTIGSVGSKDITVERYARDLQNEIRALSAQTGQPIPFATAQAIGIDRTVLGRLVTSRALDAETERLGMSVGDAEVRSRVLDVPAFRGLDGNFDREAYDETLRRSGLSIKAFEAQIREDATRTLLQGAVGAGFATVPTYENTLFNYLGARRNFIWAPLDASLLAQPVGTPSEADLTEYHTANPEAFTTPEIKKLTIAVLVPEDLLDQIDVADEDLAELYQDRIDEFVQPERRLVERLVLNDEATAQAAKDRLDAGELTFEALVTERGLDLADIDMGDMTQADLGAAGDAIFALEDPGVVGPLPSDLGPALYRMNAVLLAQNVTLEDARTDLTREIAGDMARRQINNLSREVDDLLAGGATLEEVTDETDMTLQQMDWHADFEAPLASYAAFRQAALAATTDDFPELIELDDGGIFALRLDDVVPPALEPLDDVRDAVSAAWQDSETLARIADVAEGLIAPLENGVDMASLGLTATIEQDMTRDDVIPGTPINLMSEVFEMEQNEARIVTENDQLVLVHILDILPPDETNNEILALRNAIVGGASQDLAQDILQAFSNGIQTREDIRINQTALDAVHLNFQ
ncbi:SurA N-terminal domain-containing protein [Algirhabdus cladophorae]|uniref:peptidylprolyl isomerase n=1 Tax=Algirhabdus cladophorae TaxID=3377108 RepID=UPI003B848328